MSESEKLNRRSLTPCLDENRVEDENCADNSKEIELSDISDEDEQWSECNSKNENLRANGNGNGNNQFKASAFKKITRNNRERNYRDNVRRRHDANDFHLNRMNYRKFDNSRRKEIERYNVRKVIANREFTISRSRSKSFSPRQRQENAPQRHRASFSPKRDTYKRSASPVPRQKLRYSPISPKQSLSPSPDRYRNYNYKRSQTPNETTTTRRSRSRHKHTKTKSSDKSLKRKKHKSATHHQQRKHKKSRSKSKRRSSSQSPEPSTTVRNITPTRQIMNIPNSNLPQENIKIILKNEDAFVKRQKVKKRDKKNKKISRKEIKDKPLKISKEQQQPQKKEVFASGDNILISVCFNNNNSNNNNNNHDDNGKSKTDIVSEEKISTKAKIRKRQASPISAISSEESFDKLERRQRKHKRKKLRSTKKESVSSKIPKTPPMNMNPPSTTTTKRKNDSKPIAIIDLEKSPGKEVTQSPKEVIILSDSDGEGKKRDMGGKDIVIIDDTILEKGISGRLHSPNREHLTPTNVTPESPPPSQPVLKFALKSKSNILPFNLLHDQAEELETEEPAVTTTTTNSSNTNSSNEHQAIRSSTQKDQELVNNNGNTMDEKNAGNQTEALYDPFEPTKSGSTSPVTPPPHIHDNISNELSKNNKIDLLNEKVQMLANKEMNSSQIPGLEDHHPPIQTTTSASIWSRKEFDKKSLQPVTPPLPPTYVFSASTAASSSKPHVSLYEGIYGSDLKTPAMAPSPNKMKSLKDDDDDEDRTPYSPSSDGYDYEPPPPSTSHHQNKSNFDSMKHSDIDTQSSEPSGSYSFGNDDTGLSKTTTPLKLTASTLKTFNSTMRSSGPVGLQFVNKTELSIFENYLPPSQQQNQKSPLVKRSSFMRSKMSRFTSSMNDNENGSPHRNYTDTLKPPCKLDDSMLDDDVPSSAVDLVNKDRFLKKSLRIERVAEEVKLVLKPHYNKKHITKDEYKEILRKSVPKICHNKTGEINIQKITQLIEAYIKKVRYKRKSNVASSI